VRTDIRFREGDGRNPLAVFIHGIGVNADFWTDPSRAKVLGGKYPLAILLPEATAVVTSYADLSRIGFSVLTWSQSRPAGPIESAVAELRAILTEYSRYARNGIVLVGHSRGGLVARKYLEDCGPAPRLVVTIATPHRGTSLARWAAFIAPFASALKQAIEIHRRNEADTALRRILGFLGSEGLREMLPRSAFYEGLKDVKKEGCRYLSIGGTDPDLLKTAAIPLPGLLMKVIPEKIFPEEMREGRGDGLVTAESSVLPYGDEHGNWHLNHASLLFDREVRGFVEVSAEHLPG
jgi:pimeloyl-ACP methyl ester carboxylesterase